jgi:cytochrome c-type biogenesis protein
MELGVLDIIIATIAGFVSFISPCVLPLVPAYIGYMGGRVTSTVAAQVSVAGGGGSVSAVVPPSLSARFSTGLHSVAFIAGFTFVFVTLGILGTAFVRQVGSTATVEGLIGRLGGVAIIIFGLHFMGALPVIFNRLRRVPGLLSSPLTTPVIALLGAALIAWTFTGTLTPWDTSPLSNTGVTAALALLLLAAFSLALVLGGAFVRPGEFWNKALNTIENTLYADTRRQMTTGGSTGLPSSALMGVVFAAGWTPCIGPTLGLAMTMAANQADIPRAAMLMTAYSLGMGIPFVLTALMLDSAQGGLRRLNRHMNTIKLVSGAFLVVIGFTIATGSLQDLSRRFSVEFGDFSYRVEQCVIGAVEGVIPWGQAGVCLTGQEDYTTLRQQHQESSAPATGTQLTVGRSDMVRIEQNADDPAVGLAVGDRAPDFETLTISGEPVRLSDLRGEVVLLNFWFTYCAPCRIEMPEFERMYKRYADEGFTILAVNREETAEEIQAFADELGLTFPLLLDEMSDIQFLYQVMGYPKTFILDRDGVILFVAYSALTEEQIRSLVEDALA